MAHVCKYGFFQDILAHEIESGAQDAEAHVSLQVPSARVKPLYWQCLFADHYMNESIYSPSTGTGMIVCVDESGCIITVRHTPVRAVWWSRETTGFIRFRLRSPAVVLIPVSSSASCVTHINVIILSWVAAFEPVQPGKKLLMCQVRPGVKVSNFLFESESEDLCAVTGVFILL